MLFFILLARFLTLHVLLLCFYGFLYCVYTRSLLTLLRDKYYFVFHVFEMVNDFVPFYFLSLFSCFMVS